MFLANIFDCVITDDLIPITTKKHRASIIQSDTRGRNFQHNAGLVTSQIMKKENFPRGKNIIKQAFKNN